MDTEDRHSLNKYLSPLAVWALAFGSAVGWGAFVMPGTTFLPIAGPFGTVIGMLIGAAVILIIGYNYHYMMNRFPNAGGTYFYAKKVLGYDHAFLSAWFIILVYLAIMWANATALTIVFRNFFGDFFQVGFHYQIAGFDIFGGEVFLSLFAIVGLGLICIRGGKFVTFVQIFMAAVLLGGVIIIAVVLLLGTQTDIFSITPAFQPNVSIPAALFGIAVLGPWAFSGFESVSHSAEEFSFSAKKTFAIFIAAIVVGAVAYISLTFLAISVLPGGYHSWTEYIDHVNRGFSKLPTLYAITSLLGENGFYILLASVIAGVVTGIIGNAIAASRLIFSVARDELLPEWFCKLNKYGTPSNAIIFIILFSLPIPFLGRTAISWIIDVTTIGATIAYAYTSIITFKMARKEKFLPAQIMGIVGGIISLIFFCYFMVPNFWTVSAMSTESYLILIIWSILGFVCFRILLQKDNVRSFGKSTIVWLVILFLIFFTSLMWVYETTQKSTKEVLQNLNSYYVKEMNAHGVPFDEREKMDSSYYVRRQMDILSDSMTNNNRLQMLLILVSLLIMFNIYNYIMSRENKLEREKIKADQRNKAKSRFLSNMSHDIRTPMNAIVGYTTLLRRDKTLSPEVQNYLRKIENSSDHLLALINDVLDMSRIESGKMELEKVDTDLVKIVESVHDMFATQMETKKIEFTADTFGIRHHNIICDKNRLNRVLLNLISNSYKFTPDNGKISVVVTEKESDEENFGAYEFRVKDTGIGMSPEFAERVFEAFEREKTSTVSGIQGTGLGMAITKSIVELMGGDIKVKTEQGKGTEFIINLKFELAEEKVEEENSDEHSDVNFEGKHLLLVDDIDVNREIATMLLTTAGFVIDTARNGKEAVEKVSESKPGDFDAVLMDIQMPIMDGYEATKKIRRLKNSELAKIPIIAMTANAFSEDVQNAKNAGMNGHIAKPIDVPTMLEVLKKVLMK